MRRFIWDFRGRDGREIAAHHCTHLDGFAETHSIPIDAYITGLIHENEFHSISFIEVEQPFEQIVIDLLRPQRIEESK